MFPFVHSSPTVQKIIRDNVIKELEDIKHFKTIPTENSISDAIDTLQRSDIEYMYLPEIQKLVKVSNE